MRTQLVLLVLAAVAACSAAGYTGFDCGQGMRAACCCHPSHAAQTASVQSTKVLVVPWLGPDGFNCLLSVPGQACRLVACSTTVLAPMLLLFPAAALLTLLCRQRHTCACKSEMSFRCSSALPQLLQVSCPAGEGLQGQGMASPAPGQEAGMW